MKVKVLLFIFLITFSMANAQKSKKSARLDKEKIILNNYSNLSFPLKKEANGAILRLWFDTTIYNSSILELDNALDDGVKYQSVGILKEKLKNQQRTSRMVFFNQNDGTISKVIEIDKIGPYSKSKLALLDEDDYFDAERIGVVKKKDGKADRSLIKRYITYDNVSVDHDGYVLSVFYKLGVTGTKPKHIGENKWFEKDGIKMNNQIRPSSIVDKWTTCIIYDPNGKEIFNSGELNYNVWMHHLRKDRKYLILNTGKVEDANELSNRWGGDGFTVFDVLGKKEIYRYTLPLDDRDRSMEGARFDKESELIVYSNKLPNSQLFVEETMLLNVQDRVVSKYTFTRSEWTEVTNNWKSKYKSFFGLLNSSIYIFTNEKY